MSKTILIAFFVLCTRGVAADVAHHVDTLLHGSANEATAALCRLTSCLTGSDANQRAETRHMLVSQLAQSQIPREINKVSSLIALAADDATVLIALRRSTQAQDDSIRFALLLGLQRMLQQRPRLSPSSTHEVAESLMTYVQAPSISTRNANLAVQIMAMLDNGLDLLLTVKSGKQDVRASCALYAAIGKTRNVAALTLLRRELEANGPDFTYRVQIVSAIGELFRALRGIQANIPDDETNRCRPLMMALSQEESLDLQEASLQTLAAIDPEDAWLIERISQQIMLGTDAQRLAALRLTYELPQSPARALPAIGRLAEQSDSGEIQDIAAAILAKESSRQATP